MIEKKGMSTSYQLRKIGLPASVEKVKNCYRITSNTTLIGRGQSVDVFLDSNIRKGLISRAHAQILQKGNGVNGEPVFEIFDTSLNGTYVNDVRIKGSVILKESDTIAFGHLRGSLIEPGTLAPQKETEFLFKFEKCLHPEVKEEMVDLTERELNNNSSSVFMSPKSPTGENGNQLIGLSQPPPRDPTPPEKKMKYSPTQDVHGERVDKKMYTDDDEDLKAVVVAATSKIKYNGDTSDDGSFLQIDLDTKANEIGSEVLRSGPVKLVHPRNKVIPSYLNNHPGAKLNTSLEHRHINKNGSSKNIKSKNRKSITEKVNGTIDSDDSEIESESESEYLEDSDTDSEKSEEIPDDSSDNEYIPKGKTSGNKKQTPKAPVRLKPFQQQQQQQKVINKSIAQQQQSKPKRKKSNSFTHDKCDAFNCKIPSGNLKTVTWVQCDDCDAWYHVSCSGLSVADAKKKDTIFRCGCS